MSWRHREPHCFNCGSNVPFESGELRELGVVEGLVDFHRDSEDEGVMLYEDEVLLIVRLTL